MGRFVHGTDRPWDASFHINGGVMTHGTGALRPGTDRLDAGSYTYPVVYVKWRRPSSLPYQP
jgi:hypothetical protein